MWKTYNSFCHWTERMLFKKKGCLLGAFIDLMIGVCWFGVSAVFFVAGFYYLLFSLVRWTWRKVFKKDDSGKIILTVFAPSRRPARRCSLLRRSGAAHPRRGKPGGAFGAGEGRNHSQK